MRIDRYEVRGELGRGGMGVVYLAHDPKLGRDVALKVSTASAGGRASQRADREAQSLAQLRHPNIVGLHTAGEAGGHRYLVMELVEGAPLQDALDRGEALAPREAVALARDLAAALGHAHAHGVLHRDVKPSNVLLTPEGTPRLTDFGLARTLLGTETRLSLTGSALGTPGYMAPEQIRGDRTGIGPATDVYGIGGLLYAALTCQPPVPGESLVEVMANTVGLDPDPPSEHNPAVDAVLDSLVLRCLEKEPGERFPDCAALGAALDAYLRGELGLLRRRRRVRGTALLLVAAGLVLLALWGVNAFLGRRRQAQVTQLLAQASSALAEGDPASSLRTCERALELDPRSPAALVARGDAHAAAGDAEAALKYYSRAGELAPESPDPLTHRAALLSLDNPDPAAHQDDWERALELDPDCALALTLRALFAVRSGRASDAGADLARALEIDPACALAYAARGVVERGAGRVAKARADLDRALELAPHLRLALVQRAWLRVQTDPRGSLQDLELALSLRETPHALICRARARTYLGEREAALVDLDRALELDPRNTAALIDRGRLHVQTDAYGDAVEDLRTVLELQPKSAQARLLLGAALAGLPERRKDALAELSRALELDPSLDQVLLQRAALHFDLKQFAQARADFSAFLERVPGNAQARTLLGRSHHALGDLHEAIAEYTLAVNLDPGMTEAYLRRGQALVGLGELGDPLRALDDFTKAIALDPQNADAYLDRGLVNLRRSEYRTAIQDFDDALRLRPGWVMALVNRAVSWRLLGSYEQAEKDFTRAIEAEPTNAYAHTSRGFLRANFMGDLQGALADHQRATELTPDDAVVWIHLANARKELRDIEGARAAYDRTLELDPNLRVARHDRGRFRLEQGDYAGAAEDLQRALELFERDDPQSARVSQIRTQLGQARAGLKKP